jgi:ParB-like chromosome segregation protein Spo0J
MDELRNDADYALESRATGSLHASALQLRKRKAGALKVLQKSVQELGLAAPIIIDEAGEIIDGIPRW